MARSPAPPRTVQCYHCGHRFEVSGRAQSTSCPKCNKALMVADLILKSRELKGPKREERTCGKIVVPKKARLIVDRITAHGGIEVQGTLEAKHIIAGGKVRIGPHAKFKGELHAMSVTIESGAVIQPSVFAVPDDPTGLAEPDEEPADSG